jgi:hypothetical protein
MQAAVKSLPHASQCRKVGYYPCEVPFHQRFVSNLSFHNSLCQHTGYFTCSQGKDSLLQSHITKSMAEAPAPDPEAGVEADDHDDNESSLAGLQNSTASISSSIMKFREENGRTYHAYQDGKYLLPNDEREQDRLDLQHHLFTLTFDGKLFTCDADKAERQVRRVLDAGCGTGIWAIDFADEHPKTEVLGIDLSPIQPAFLPPNVTFVVDDLEQEWTFDDKFDFIYMRMLSASILDFSAMFKNSFE